MYISKRIRSFYDLITLVFNGSFIYLLCIVTTSIVKNKYTTELLLQSERRNGDNKEYNKFIFISYIKKTQKAYSKYRKLKWKSINGIVKTLTERNNLKHISGINADTELSNVLYVMVHQDQHNEMKYKTEYLMIKYSFINKNLIYINYFRSSSLSLSELSSCTSVINSESNFVNSLFLVMEVIASSFACLSLTSFVSDFKIFRLLSVVKYRTK